MVRYQTPFAANLPSRNVFARGTSAGAAIDEPGAFLVNTARGALVDEADRRIQRVKERTEEQIATANAQLQLKMNLQKKEFMEREARIYYEKQVKPYLTAPANETEVARRSREAWRAAKSPSAAAKAPCWFASF